jgi:hypothetical protein
MFNPIKNADANPTNIATLSIILYLYNSHLPYVILIYFYIRVNIKIPSLLWGLNPRPFHYK